MAVDHVELARAEYTAAVEAEAAAAVAEDDARTALDVARKATVAAVTRRERAEKALLTAVAPNRNDHGKAD